MSGVIGEMRWSSLAPQLHRPIDVHSSSARSGGVVGRCSLGSTSSARVHRLHAHMVDHAHGDTSRSDPIRSTDRSIVCVGHSPIASAIVVARKQWCPPSTTVGHHGSRRKTDCTLTRSLTHTGQPRGCSADLGHARDHLLPPRRCLTMWPLVRRRSVAPSISHGDAQTNALPSRQGSDARRTVDGEYTYRR
jgi:hypothetical protein